MIKSSDYNHRLYEIAREGKSGDWELKKEIVPKYEVVYGFNARKGTYSLEALNEAYPSVVLYYDPQEKLRMMADLASDQAENELVIDHAHGKMLTAGLGLGLLPLMLEGKLSQGIITQIDIVEVNEDVINLCWGHTKKPGLNLISGDIWEYLKGLGGKTYDFIYIDIWASRAEAIAEGLIIADLAKKGLAEGGEVRYWLQEIKEKLLPNRGVPYELLMDIDSRCRLCGRRNHAHLYGCLCKECADEYESFLYGNDEVHANGELSRTLASLGYKTLAPHKLPNGKEIDILVGSDGKKYLVEGKKDLTNRNEFDRLLGQIQQYSTLRKQGFSGLKLVIYGDVDHNLYIDLKNTIMSTYGTWIVDLVLKGKLV